jgi:hypothetical protein
MTKKTVTARLLSLSTDKLSFFCPTTDEFRKREDSELTQSGQPDLRLKHNLVTRQGAAVSSLQEFNGSLPGIIQSRFFIDSNWPSLLSFENRGRPAMQASSEDEFHDSNAGIDIYALFNAVNGIIRNGVLDVSELDKYSPADAEALNVSGLREVWKHTLTGCSQCREIITALNELRGAVREVAETADRDDQPKSDKDHIKPIS